MELGQLSRQIIPNYRTLKPALLCDKMPTEKGFVASEDVKIYSLHSLNILSRCQIEEEN